MKQWILQFCNYSMFYFQFFNKVYSKTKNSLSAFANSQISKSKNQVKSNESKKKSGFLTIKVVFLLPVDWKYDRLSFRADDFSFDPDLEQAIKIEHWASKKTCAKFIAQIPPGIGE